MRGIFLAVGAGVLLAFTACSPPDAAEGEDKKPVTTASAGASLPSTEGDVADQPSAEFRFIGGDGVFAMIVDPESDPADWRTSAKEHCGGREFCQVMAWTDPSMAATAMPMTDLEVETKVFQYSINRISGLDRAVWECAALAKAGIDSCPKSVGE